ncbi:MAG: MATE family efflux transporter [Lachnospiraceae bacterium]
MEKIKKFWKDDKKSIKYALQVAWPAIVDSFFVAVVALVDSFMVSQMGTYAVAAIGLTVQPKFIGLTVFIAISTAVSATVARRKGEGDKRAANETMFTAMIIAMIAVVFVSILSVCFANQIISFIGSEPETHADAVIYLRIIMGALVFTIISWIINAAQRGSGNTKLAMKMNVVANSVNVIFNYLLIGGNFGFPALGVRGAAIATVIGTIVGSGMSISSLFNKKSYVSVPYIIKEKIKPSFRIARTIYNFAVNVFVEQIMLRIGFLISAMLTAGLGTVALAVNQVAGNILSLSFSFGDGLQIAAVTLIGQSLGEGKPKKAVKYGSICQMIGLCISLVLAVLFFMCGKMFFAAFFPQDVEAIELGSLLIPIIVLIVLFQISQVIYMGSLRAAGDVKFTTMVSTVSVTVFRPLICYVFAYLLGIGLVGVWIGIFAEQCIKLGLTFWRFKSGKWMDKKI